MMVFHLIVYMYMFLRHVSFTGQNRIISSSLSYPAAYLHPQKCTGKHCGYGYNPWMGQYSGMYGSPGSFGGLGSFGGMGSYGSSAIGGLVGGLLGSGLGSSGLGSGYSGAPGYMGSLMGFQGGMPYDGYGYHHHGITGIGGSGTGGGKFFLIFFSTELICYSSLHMPTELV